MANTTQTTITQPQTVDDQWRALCAELDALITLARGIGTAYETERAQAALADSIRAALLTTEARTERLATEATLREVQAKGIAYVIAQRK